MAAFDSDIIDALGEIERGISLYAKIEKSIEPLTAGIEMDDSSFEFAFAKLCIPWAHPRALKTGPEHNVVLVEAVNVRRRKIGAAPIEIVERAPGLAVTVFGFLLFHVVLL